MRLSGFSIPSAEQVDDALRHREIAGGGEHHDALARPLEEMQLAKGRDIVEPGVGARVGDHDEAVAHENATTIGHRRSDALARLRRRARPAGGRGNLAHRKGFRRTKIRGRPIFRSRRCGAARFRYRNGDPGRNGGGAGSSMVRAGRS